MTYQFLAAEPIRCGDFVETRPHKDRTSQHVWRAQARRISWYLRVAEWARVWKRPVMAGLALADAQPGEAVTVLPSGHARGQMIRPGAVYIIGKDDT